jgi:hypothetical protein
MDDERHRQILAYLRGEGFGTLNASDRRYARALLKEHQRKQEWLRDKLPCPRCHGEGLETVANPDDAPIVKSGRGYRLSPCLHCHGMRYVTIAQTASGELH